MSIEQWMKNLDRNELNCECQRWAFAHGKCVSFVQRCFALNDDSNVIPYPFTIYPSPYPRNEYERACRIQSAINRLVYRLAFDIQMMDSVLEKFIDCDPFIKRLREIYDHIQQLPYQSVAETCIIRTDYMLQEMSQFVKRTKLRLIEINTIAIGLGAAAKVMREWHKIFLTKIQSDFVSQLPKNESHDLVIESLLESWKIYDNPKAMILFVIPEREFNIGDQMLIEQGLLSRCDHPSLLIKHVTLIEISRCCSLNSKGILFFREFEVALVYYRTAYDPKHFYNEDIWQAYIMLESSCAVKCPSLRYHLAGMKCFQLALTEESFLKEVFNEEQEFIDDVTDITEEMFTIEQAMNDPVVQQRILEHPECFYLKQSREGGGNVYCGEMLKERLNEIVEKNDSKRYFLMSRISPPIRPSLICSKGSIIERQINSELGIFGSLITQNGKLVSERSGGYLLRSKPSSNIEGGIASGQGYIDSIYLV
ncbi:unnamed protein product [Adineta ricciae]|uniref:Glutathione synthetase n=1 Tax=Adineta ricciae TaxID=249248 RepID=A0A814C097_ADIRI|nr:unnamed protein product [Adineta ricciae]